MYETLWRMLHLPWSRREQLRNPLESLWLHAGNLFTCNYLKQHADITSGRLSYSRSCLDCLVFIYYGLDNCRIPATRSRWPFVLDVNRTQRSHVERCLKTRWWSTNVSLKIQDKLTRRTLRFLSVTDMWSRHIWSPPLLSRRFIDHPHLRTVHRKWVQDTFFFSCTEIMNTRTLLIMHERQKKSRRSTLTCILCLI